VCSSENIHVPPMALFCFEAPHPPQNSIGASYFVSKTFTFKTPPSPSIGIADDLP